MAPVSTGRLTAHRLITFQFRGWARVEDHVPKIASHSEAVVVHLILEVMVGMIFLKQP
jgi:hypothetical protein